VSTLTSRIYKLSRRESKHKKGGYICIICAETIAAGVAAVTVGAAYLRVQIANNKLKKEECPNESHQEKKSS